MKNKFMKKTLAAALALTLVRGGLPTSIDGNGLLKPAIAADAAEYYGFKISGTDVSSDNASDILKNGIFSYNDETHTLIIKGDYTANNDTPLIENYYNDLIINATNPSKLTAKTIILNYGIVTIKSDQKLELNGLVKESPSLADDGDELGSIYWDDCYLSSPQKGYFNSCSDDDLTYLMQADGKTFAENIVFETLSNTPMQDVKIGTKWYIGDVVKTDAYFYVPSIAYNKFDGTYYPTNTTQFLHRELQFDAMCRQGSDGAEKIYYFDVNGSPLGTNALDGGARGIEVVSGIGTEENPFFLVPILENRTVGASLTLGESFNLNFYSYISNDTQKVVLNGPQGTITISNFSNVRNSNGMCVFSYPVYATQANEIITLKMYGQNDELLDIFNSNNKPIEDKTIKYSVNTYLENVIPDTSWSESKKATFNELINATKNYVNVSEAYFNNTALPTGISNNENELKLDKFKPSFQNPGEDKMSLVLDSKFAVRLYIKDLAEDATATYQYLYEAKDNYAWSEKRNISAQKGKGDAYYFEIDDLTPKMLDIDFKITYNGNEYTFKPLSWAYFVMNRADNNDKNTVMANALYEYCNKNIAFVKSK